MSEAVLVTGAGGCIGAWVIKSLLAQGRNVVAMDLVDDRRRLELITSSSHAAAVPWEVADIADIDAIDRAVVNHNVEAIIHLAALQVPFCKANPVVGAQVNVVGTVNVFEVARKHQIKRLAYASSVAAHGLFDNSPWLATLYGSYKLCNENCAQVYWQDWQVPSTGIRPNIVYGPARDQGISSFPTFAMLAAVTGDEFEIPFSGTIGYLYAGEAAAAFIQAVDQDREGAPVFDLNGTALSIEDSVQLIKDRVPEARVGYSGKPLPFPGDLDDQPLRDHIGDYRQWSFEQGLDETLDVFKTLADAGQIAFDPPMY